MWDERTKIGFRAFQILQRYEVFKKVKEGKLNIFGASKILSLSYEHTGKLYRRFIANGLEGIIVYDRGGTVGKRNKKYLFGEALCILK